MHRAAAQAAQPRQRQQSRTAKRQSGTRASEAEQNKMHRVVRPPIAFIPRQRHVAEGGCTTWGHRTAECAKCSCVRMQACCTRCNWLRMQAVAVIETAKAWLRKRSPSRRSAALCAEQCAAGCGCRLAAPDATGSECWLLPCHEQRSTAAVTKPFRAGVRRLQG